MVTWPFLSFAICRNSQIERIRITLFTENGRHDHLTMLTPHLPFAMQINFRPNTIHFGFWNNFHCHTTM